MNVVADRLLPANRLDAPVAGRSSSVVVRLSRTAAARHFFPRRQSTAPAGGRDAPPKFHIGQIQFELEGEAGSGGMDNLATFRRIAYSSQWYRVVLYRRNAACQILFFKLFCFLSKSRIQWSVENHTTAGCHAMRELTIGTNDAGQRLDRFLAKTLPLLPPALAQKYIRIKRVKVNGRRRPAGSRAWQEGDVLQLYINDEFFDKPSEENIFLTLFKPQLDIVYEDENLLLVGQAAGHGGPRRRDGEGQHPHQPHSGLPLPEAGVEPQVGARLRPRPVQPHRPQHRRHRHRRQGCRDAAAHQREDTPAGAGQAVSVRDGGASEAGQRARGVLPAEGRGRKSR